MITLIFVLIYLTFLAISLRYVLLYRSMIFSSFLGAYVLSFFTLNYIGLAILYFGLDTYRWEIGISDPVLISQMLIYSIIAFATVSMTYWFFNRRVFEPYASNIRASKQEKYLVGILTLFSAFIVIQYIRNLDGIALLMALSGDFESALVARSDMSNNLGSYRWFRIGLMQVPMILFYFAYLNTPRNSALHILGLSGLFIIVAIILSLSTEKFAVIQFIIGLLFLQMKYVRRLSISGILTWAGGLIGIVVFFYMAFSGISELSEVIRIAGSRIFTGSIGTAHFYLEYFPEVHPFLFGRSLPNPMGIFPFESFSPAVEIMNWKFPIFLQKGIVGSSPSTFWAEGYANMGAVGVIIAALYIGTLLAVSQRVFNHYNKFLFIRAVEGWYFTFIFAVNISGVSEYMKVTVFVPLVVLLILPRIRWA